MRESEIMREYFISDLLYLCKGRGFVQSRLHSATKILEALGEDQLFEDIRAKFIAILRSLPDPHMAEALLAANGLLEGFEGMRALAQRREKYGAQIGCKQDTLSRLEKLCIEELANRLLTLDYTDILEKRVSVDIPEPTETTGAGYIARGKVAIEAHNLTELTLALESLKSHVSIAQLLVGMTKNPSCMEQEGFVSLFHSNLSKMTNNVYILQVMQECLTEGYFKDKPEELVNRHIHMFSNQRYLYLMLEFLYKNGLRELAEKHKHLLTHKKYVQRIEQTFG